MSNLETTATDIIKAWLGDVLSEFDESYYDQSEHTINVGHEDLDIEVLNITFKFYIDVVCDPDGNNYSKELSNIRVSRIEADGVEILSRKLERYTANKIFDYFNEKIQ